MSGYGEKGAASADYDARGPKQGAPLSAQLEALYHTSIDMRRGVSELEGRLFGYRPEPTAAGGARADPQSAQEKIDFALTEIEVARRTTLSILERL